VGFSGEFEENVLFRRLNHPSTTGKKKKRKREKAWGPLNIQLGGFLPCHPNQSKNKNMWFNKGPRESDTGGTTMRIEFQGTTIGQCKRMEQNNR